MLPRGGKRGEYDMEFVKKHNCHLSTTKTGYKMIAPLKNAGSSRQYEKIEYKKTTNFFCYRHTSAHISRSLKISVQKVQKLLKILR
jgi:hypothetical protein